MAVRKHRKIVFGVRHGSSALRAAATESASKPSGLRAKPLGQESSAAAQTRSGAKRLARLDNLTREILVARGVIRRTGHMIGKMLIEIKERELYKERDYKTFDDYLARALSLPERTAYRYMRIANQFSATAVKHLGADKLEFILQYADVAKLEQKGDELLRTEIPVEGDDGKKTLTPLGQASVRQLRGALKKLGGKKSGGFPRALSAKVEALKDALPPAPPGTRQTDRVTLTRGSDGNFAVNFSSIPVDSIGPFLKAVRAHLG